MSDLYLDAEWSPAELEAKAYQNPHKISDPVEYHAKYRAWRSGVRFWDSVVQRCLVVSIGLFLWVCVLALLLGAV